MKLIDLLVQELPKHGGWPVCIDNISMHEDGDIFFDGKYAPKSFVLPKCSDGWGPGNRLDNTTTREQYESALAASQQPAWNGEGLPPVGCECEFKEQSEKYWQKGVVRYISDHTIVINIYPEEDEYGDKEPCFENDGSLSFRPIRTEADRKREECVDLIMGWMHHAGRAEIELIYDYISAGKIPGIKLDGDA